MDDGTFLLQGMEGWTFSNKDLLQGMEGPLRKSMENMYSGVGKELIINNQLSAEVLAYKFPMIGFHNWSYQIIIQESRFYKFSSAIGFPLINDQSPGRGPDYKFSACGTINYQAGARVISFRPHEPP